MVSPSATAHSVTVEDLNATIAAIKGRWKSGILAQLAQQPHRFAELRRAVPGISEKVLMQALKELEADRLISRTADTSVPPRVEYAMTDHGHSLCALVSAMAGWGKAHRALLASADD